MKLLAKTLPVLCASIGCAQTPMDYAGKKIDYGYSNSTFAGGSVNYLSSSFIQKENLDAYLPLNIPKTTSFNYGWKQGFFLWVNVSRHISYKPQLDLIFCINNYDSSPESECNTSFGIEYKPQLVIRLGTWDPQPEIKMAHDMSYYLTGRQPYLIIGPKFNYQRFSRSLKNDRGNYNAIGLVAGLGMDNLFPNLNVDPELILSLEYQTGNLSIQQASRFYTSLCFAMNFF